MEATPEELAAFARALSAEMGTVSRADLAASVSAIAGESVSTSAISQYVNGQNEPSRRKVFAFEEALGIPPGALSRHLGYLPATARPPANIDEALADAGVPRPARRLILATVNAALEGSR